MSMNISLYFVGERIGSRYSPEDNVVLAGPFISLMDAESKRVELSSSWSAEPYEEKELVIFEAKLDPRHISEVRT